MVVSAHARGPLSCVLARDTYSNSRLSLAKTRVNEVVRTAHNRAQTFTVIELSAAGRGGTTTPERRLEESELQGRRDVHYPRSSRARARAHNFHIDVTNRKARAHCSTLFPPARSREFFSLTFTLQSDSLITILSSVYVCTKLALSRHAEMNYAGVRARAHCRLYVT